MGVVTGKSVSSKDQGKGKFGPTALDFKLSESFVPSIGTTAPDSRRTAINRFGVVELNRTSTGFRPSIAENPFSL